MQKTEVRLTSAERSRAFPDMLPTSLSRCTTQLCTTHKSMRLYSDVTGFDCTNSPAQITHDVDSVCNNGWRCSKAAKTVSRQLASLAALECVLHAGFDLLEELCLHTLRVRAALHAQHHVLHPPLQRLCHSALIEVTLRRLLPASDHMCTRIIAFFEAAEVREPSPGNDTRCPWNTVVPSPICIATRLGTIWHSLTLEQCTPECLCPGAWLRCYDAVEADLCGLAAVLC